MKWASAVSEKMSMTEAVRDAAAVIRDELSGVRPDLVLAFVSHHHRDDYDKLPELVAKELGAIVFLGCSAGGVIGGGHEVENRPGLSLTAAVLPGTAVTPFHRLSADLPDLDDSPRAWQEWLGVAPCENLHFIVLPEPFSFDAESFLLGLDYAYPQAGKIGGLASGGNQPDQNALFLGDTVHREGLVGVALSGDIRLETVVAQGCRPIGEPCVVTRAQRNILMELDGRSAMDVLREVYRGLSARDQELFNHSLFLGVVMDDSRDSYRQGDFLIRNILGADRDSGVLAIGALLKDRQVVQFHLRDAATSALDLETLLQRHAAESPAPVAGCLLFSCLGRGSYLYGRSDHDTDIFREIFGRVPVGGFFCNGEIGPVSGTTFIHGYTSAFGIFRPPTHG